MTGGAISAAFRGRLGGFDLDVAFEAPMRGVTALFGPSGCGKTTVLRCMAGLEHLPGRLSVGSDVWQDSAAGRFLPPHKRPLGYVFQEPSLFPHLSVRRNLAYGARRRGNNARGPGPGFDDVVALLGIAPLLGRDPAALSGGERQRVSIGRALLSHPRLLLMDEPLAALDRAAKDEILPHLEALHETLAIPVIYVSHDIAEVTRIADRMVMLERGRTRIQGPMTEILERLDLHPSTGRFEAGVLITARVTGHDQTFKLTELDHHGQRLVMPITDAEPGSEIRLRIRARDVSLALERPKAISVRNVLEGTIAGIVEEPDTAFAETLIDIGGGRIRSRVTRASAADLGLAPGKPVFALVKSITFERRNLAPRPQSEEAG